MVGVLAEVGVGGSASASGVLSGLVSSGLVLPRFGLLAGSGRLFPGLAERDVNWQMAAGLAAVSGWFVVFTHVDLVTLTVDYMGRRVGAEELAGLLGADPVRAGRDVVLMISFGFAAVATGQGVASFAGRVRRFLPADVELVAADGEIEQTARGVRATSTCDSVRMGGRRCGWVRRCSGCCPVWGCRGGWWRIWGSRWRVWLRRACRACGWI